MRPKKVITPEHRDKMMAGLRAAKRKRTAILDRQENKADAIESIHALKEAIDLQLQSVSDDVVTVRKLLVRLERTSGKQDWGSAFRFAAAINTISSSIARKIEVCAAQADVVNKLAAAMKKGGLIALFLFIGFGSIDGRMRETNQIEHQDSWPR